MAVILVMGSASSGKRSLVQGSMSILRSRCFTDILYFFTCGPSPKFDRPYASELKLQGTIPLQNRSTRPVYSSLANIALISMFSHVSTMISRDKNSPKLRERVAESFSGDTPGTTSDAFERYRQRLRVFFIDYRQLYPQILSICSAPGVASVLRDRRLVVWPDHSRDDRALPGTLPVPLVPSRAFVDAAVSSLLGTGATEDPSSTTPSGAGAGAGRADSDGNRTLVSPQRQECVVEVDALFDVYPLTISTKYYSVQVEMWRQAKALSVPGLRCAEPEGLEGIIVVVDLTEAASLEEAEGWASFVEAKEACAFKVCVGSKGRGTDVMKLVLSMPASKVKAMVDLVPGLESTGEGGDKDAALEERRRRCLEWCLDHGFEYVEADCRDPLQGGDSREKEGVPRVVESLESNLWTNMEYRTQNRPSASLMSRTAALDGRRSDGLGARDADGGVEDSDEGDDAGGTGGGSENATMGSGVASDDDPAALGYGVLESDDEDGAGGAGGAGDAGVYGDAREKREDGESEGDHPGIELKHLELQARWERGAGKSQGFCAAQLADADSDADPGTDLVERFDRFEDPAASSSNGARDMDGVHDAVATKAEGAGADTGASTKRIGLSGSKGLGDSPVSPTDSPRENGQEAVVAEPTPAQGEDAPGDRAGELGVNEPEPSRTGSRENLGSREPPRTSERGSRGKGVTSIVSSASAVASDGDDRGPQHEKRSTSSANSKDAVDAAESFIKNLGIVDEFDDMEWLMSEVRNAREGTGNVSDEERRARAANVAMRLAALIGEGDDSDDD